MFVKKKKYDNTYFLISNKEEEKKCICLVSSDILWKKEMIIGAKGKVTRKEYREVTNSTSI
jgi:hypothetical protein